MSEEQKTTKGFTGGLIMVLIFGAVLFWAEGHYKGLSGAINEAKKLVIAMPNNQKVDKAFDGKLVYTQGMASTQDSLEDNRFGIRAAGLGFAYDVEYYQWVKDSKKKKSESSTTKTESSTSATKTTTSSTTKKSSSYKAEWVERVASAPVGEADKDNTPILFLENEVEYVERVTLGAYVFDLPVLSGITESRPLNIRFSDQQLMNIHNYILEAARRSGNASESVEEYYEDRDSNQPPYILAQMDGDVLFLGEEPNDPDVGDMRIRFSVIPQQEVTVIATVNGDTLEAFRSSNGYTLTFVESGKVDMKTMFEMTERGSNAALWLIRAVLALLMIVCARFTIPAMGEKLGIEALASMNGWVSGAGAGLVLAGIISFVGQLL